LHTSPINPNDTTPIYQQITNRLQYGIACGLFTPHDQLPSVRQLAVELLVNPNTVAKAYRELEREGFSYSRKGLGVFVTEAAPDLCRQLRLRAVAERIGDALNEAIRSGLDPEKIRALTHKLLETKLGEPPTHRKGD